MDPIFWRPWAASFLFCAGVFSMKRFFKWVLRVVVVIVLIPVIALAGAYGYHRSIVGAGPGTLPGAPEPQGRVATVDTFIGTGGYPWMGALNSVAACVPFGMVRLGPDTKSWIGGARNLNRSGYYYGDKTIIGFSHNRLVGADAKEGGAFRVFPTTAAQVGTVRGDDRGATFSHAAERAFPGYYGVQLDESGIKAEMTATTRVGIHRYTFPKGETPVLLIDLGSALAERRCENVRGAVDAATGTITGSMLTRGSFSGRYDGLNVYFAAQLSAPIAKAGVVKDGALQDGATTLDGDGLFELAFAPGTGSDAAITLALALSYVSVENAKANLTAEYTGQRFEDIVAAGGTAWNGYLDRIAITGGTPAQQRIFYTGLYRAFIMPTIFNDVNGQYTGFDKQVHLAEGFTYYTDFSLWDTFRTVHPLYSLIARREHSDMMRSLTEMAKTGGALPRWPSGAGYTNCMFGTPADLAVSEAYLKGIRGFDVEAAYAAARHTALIGVPEGSRFAGREGLEWYLKLGYVPYDKSQDSVACTLDYAWCDYALSEWAKALGKEEDAAIFAKHAQTYHNVWNPQTMFFQGRDSEGRFDERLDPLRLTYTDPDKEYTGAYVEGSAMQWRWGVPHDPKGLIALWPDPKAFVTDLRSYMDGTRKQVGWWHPGGNYWHGNEPYIHAPYLFNAAGRPDLTQRYVRRILATKYEDNYYGLDGNDDGGTLSSWYVLSALGFYPIAGTTRYEVGIPLFDQAVIDMGEGKKLTVTAKDNSPYAIHVYNLIMNNKEVSESHFDHALIAEGGDMQFTLGVDPAGKVAPPRP